MQTGDIIRTLREKQGLSQESLAALLGYRDRSSIAKIEAGKVDLAQSKLERLSQVFGVSVPYLMVLPEAEAPAPGVPILGAIACGAPILASEHIDSYTYPPDRVSADFALRCRGDSMIGARIFDGDLVFIRQQETVENGEIAAVLIDGEATLKRVRRTGDRMYLEPENPRYRPIILYGEEMNTARILGKAVAFTSTVL